MPKQDAFFTWFQSLDRMRLFSKQEVELMQEAWHSRDEAFYELEDKLGAVKADRDYWFYKDPENRKIVGPGEKRKEVNEMDNVLQERMDALAERRANPPKRVRDEDLYAGSAMHFYCNYCGTMSATLPESYDPRNYDMEAVHTCSDCQELKSMGVKLDKDWRG